MSFSESVVLWYNSICVYCGCGSDLIARVKKISTARSSGDTPLHKCCRTGKYVSLRNDTCNSCFKDCGHFTVYSLITSAHL